ncbi:MAG: hypothetical protein M3198_09820 [Actinomycetota bacterium]|nr:hypothetical protein [Actinomycetota bacterium]
MRLFGLGIAEWVTIVLLAGSIPLTLRIMARASAAYERKAAERVRASGDVPPGADGEPLEQGEERN